ncbi:MAG: acyl-CoA thioesterase-1 [Flavobacterium sp.]
MPARYISPPVGKSRPAIKLNKVVLPDPEAPTIATDSDFLISRLIPFRMVNCPSDVLTLLQRSTVLIILCFQNSLYSQLLRLKLHYGTLIICTLLFSTASVAESSIAETGTIVVFGDSVSAGYGIQPENGWVNLLNQRLTEEFPQYNAVNASVSGETTGGGLVRLPKTLGIHKPNILILELGGNDGLRGYPISKIEGNLNAMIRLAQSANAKVLLIGMVLPPNYGHRYTTAYEALYQRLGALDGIEFLPVLLEGVNTSENLLQRDGIHPTKEAQPLLLDNIWPLLVKFLD